MWAIALALVPVPPVFLVGAVLAVIVLLRRKAGRDRAVAALVVAGSWTVVVAMVVGLGFALRTLEGMPDTYPAASEPDPGAEPGVVSGPIGIEPGTVKIDADPVWEHHDRERLPSSLLGVGACLNMPMTGEEIGTVLVLPCDEPHTAEVYAVFELEDVAYPGESVVWPAAEDGCVRYVEQFVGEPYATSPVQMHYFYPTGESWDLDRVVTCVLSTGTSTGSLRGSADVS